MKTIAVAIILLVLQQHVDLSCAVRCASNPCNLVTGSFDSTTGYSCYDIPGSSTDSVCICPAPTNPVLNGPCRTGTVTPAGCTRTCVNGGVCNIVSSQQVCWCLLGFSGSFCELQGLATRCNPSPCVAGTCFEQTVGTSQFAYCSCNPGYTGTTCNQCYFQCSQTGIFPDTAFCAVGRYFYCPQASGAPIVALCPDGQRFNRNTNLCDANYNCT